MFSTPCSPGSPSSLSPPLSAAARCGPAAASNQESDGRIQIVTSLSSVYLKEGRYSGSLDNENGQYNLTIADLHRNDSAVYFCIARAAARQFAPGSSTKLVVSDPLTVPSVELYSPGLFEGDTDWTEPVPVLCLVKDTSPGRHRVLWTIGAEAPTPGSAEEGEIEPDGCYSVPSYVTISADQWHSGAIKCETYNVKNVTEKVSASHRRQDPLTVPSVELYSPGLFEGDTDWTEPVPVLCLVKDTSPGRHRVLWTIGAEAPTPGSAEEGEIEPDGCYSVPSYVTISADQWHSGAIKCETYNVKNVTEKVSAHICFFYNL
ncbi:UNVERIFIED_CONTAM: hypothetical protein FKN15_048849 [Acipenser sinensis]